MWWFFGVSNNCESDILYWYQNKKTGPVFRSRMWPVKIAQCSDQRCGQYSTVKMAQCSDPGSVKMAQCLDPGSVKMAQSSDPGSVKMAQCSDPGSVKKAQCSDPGFFMSVVPALLLLSLTNALEP